jgi:hypothetical protein
MMSEEETVEKLSMLYQEVVKVASVFWEGRYKVMTFFFTGVAGLFTLSGWVYRQPELRRWLPLPLLLGAILSFISFFLDLRNADILRACYSFGKEIEIELIKRGGVFKAIGKARHMTYTFVLRSDYIGAGLLLPLLFVVVIQVSALRIVSRYILLVASQQDNWSGEYVANRLSNLARPGRHVNL